jgi:hypothetical protein
MSQYYSSILYLLSHTVLSFTGIVVVVVMSPHCMTECASTFTYQYLTKIVYNEQCHDQNTKHHINISAVVHPRFKVWSSAIHYGHLSLLSVG